MPKLNRKAEFILEAFNWAIEKLKKYSDDETKAKAIAKKEEVDKWLFPSKYKYFYIKKANTKKRKNKKLRFSKNTDPRIIATKLAGHKGGTKTALTHSREERVKWTTKAGNTTVRQWAIRGGSPIPRSPARLREHNPARKNKRRRLRGLHTRTWSNRW